MFSYLEKYKEVRGCTEEEKCNLQDIHDHMDARSKISSHVWLYQARKTADEISINNGSPESSNQL